HVAARRYVIAGLLLRRWCRCRWLLHNCPWLLGILRGRCISRGGASGLTIRRRIGRIIIRRLSGWIERQGSARSLRIRLWSRACWCSIRNHAAVRTDGHGTHAFRLARSSICIVHRRRDLGGTGLPRRCKCRGLSDRLYAIGHWRCHPSAPSVLAEIGRLFFPRYDALAASRCAIINEFLSTALRVRLRNYFVRRISRTDCRRVTGAKFPKQRAVAVDATYSYYDKAD